MKRYLFKQSIKQLAMSFLGKALLVSFCMCLPLVSVRGQQHISLDVPRIVPVSPEATMMEKFQSYPVDLCTGVPDITIPLYEIDLGELTIPVTLSYHASGLRPKEQSGLAGTGWTLNLEPSVSRQINGIPDEEQYGWFRRYDSWNQVPVWEEDRYDYYSKKTNNTYDTYPDKFTYRLPHSGSSGYFNTHFSPLSTAPRTNDRVMFDGSNYIEITDASGVRYSFGGQYETLDDYVTRWLCDGIYSARNGDQLADFSYRIDQNLHNPSEFYNLDDKLIFVSRNDRDEEVIMIDQNAGNYYELIANNDDESDPEPHRKVIQPSELDINYSPNGSFIPGRVSRAWLDEVRFMGNNHLNVYYKTTGKVPNNTNVYDRIEVTDDKGKRVRLIQFYITPYNSHTSLSKLDSVRVSAPGVEDRVYNFSYHDPYSVPSIYTTNVDHWGFCNGGEGSEAHTIPSIRTSFLFDTNGLGVLEVQRVRYDGINREPSGEAARYGVLKTVTDPEGIRTTFTYEGNAAAFRDNSKDKAHRDYLHPVGGIRVSGIQIYDPHTGKRIRKSYRYGLTDLYEKDYEPVWGGGAVKHLVTQRDYYSKMKVCATSYDDRFRWTEHVDIYASMPVSDISFNGSVPVMYNVVEEVVQGDGDGRSWYKNMYYYKVRLHEFEDLLEWDDADPQGSVHEFLLSSITDENRSLVRREPYRNHEPSDDFGFGASDQMYGALLRTDYYRDGELIESRENIYEKKNFYLYEEGFDVYEQLQVISREDYLEGHYEGDIWTSYHYIPDVYTFRMLDKEIVRRYHRQGSRTDTVTVERDYDYRYDYSDPGVSLSPARMETVMSDGRLSVDDYEYLDGYPSILSFHRHVEAEDSVESRILFRKDTPVPEKVQSRTDGMEDYRDEVMYTRYDGNLNPTEIRGKDGTPVSFIWSYRNRFPIARIENVPVEEVYAALGVSDLDDLAFLSEPSDQTMQTINKLRALLPSARVTTYLYDPLKGVVSVTDPNGVESRYAYDSYARLTESSYIDEDLRKIILQKYVYKF